MYIYVYIYINDIVDVVSNKILKFADDTKLYRIVTNHSDTEELRSDLFNICNWSKDWLMLFIIDKCKTLHTKFCIQAWSSDLRKDIDLLGKVQRRATQLIYALNDLRN